MANLYFDESLSDDECAVDALLVVTGEEARHAVRVSRLRSGERTVVGNGRGVLAEGVVETVDRDRFSVRVDAVRRVPREQPRLVLAQALAKGDRDERAVEQATEFGVDAILPWQAERSISRWDGGEKAAKGHAKWQRITREASKQSMRARVPEVLPMHTLAELCALARVADVLVLHPRGTEKLSAWQPGPEEHDVVLVIGPEGGFSDGELDTLESSGAIILVLGETVLRTSSAGPAALATLNVTLSRW